MGRDEGARLRLLREAPGYRLLFLATLASSVGTWLAFVALVVDVYDRTGDATWVSALLIVEFAPTVLIGLFAGPLLDRLPRRRTLVACDLARAGVFFVLPYAGSPAGIVLLAAAAGTATSFFRPAVYAGLPNLVGDDDLPHANGLLNAAESVTWAVGSLAGGALVAAAGPSTAYWLNGATFVVSALLVLRIRARLEEGEAPPSEGHWRDLVTGYRVVRGSVSLRTVVVAWSLAMIGIGALNVAEVVLAKEVFDAGDFGYGVMLAAAAVGLTAGSLLGGGWVETRGVRLPYLVSVGLMGGGAGAAAVSPNVWIAAVAIVVVGFGNGIAIICNAVLVQRGAPDRVRGRVFTFVMSVGNAVLGVAMIIAGPLTNALGARTAWGIAAVAFGVAAVVGFAMLGGLERETEPEHGEEALQPSSFRVL
jgi:MFS family permease